LEKTFTLTRTGSLKIHMDVFNRGGHSGFNIQENPKGILSVSDFPSVYQTSEDFCRILNIYGVRTIRLGLRLIF